MAAKYLNVQQIIAIDIVDAKLHLAKEFGATDLLNSRTVPSSDVIVAVKSLTPNGAGVDFAVDCTGVIKVINDMIEVIAPNGTATVVGAMPAGSRIDIDAAMFLQKAAKLITVVEGDSNPQVFIPELIDLHNEGKFPVERLVKVYPAEKMDEAIADLRDGKVCDVSALIFKLSLIRVVGF